MKKRGKGKSPLLPILAEVPTSQRSGASPGWRRQSSPVTWGQPQLGTPSPGHSEGHMQNSGPPHWSTHERGGILFKHDQMLNCDWMKTVSCFMSFFIL